MSFSKNLNLEKRVINPEYQIELNLNVIKREVKKIIKKRILFDEKEEYLLEIKLLLDLLLRDYIIYEGGRKDFERLNSYYKKFNKKESKHYTEIYKKLSKREIDKN